MSALLPSSVKSKVSDFKCDIAVVKALKLNDTGNLFKLTGTDNRINYSEFFVLVVLNQ